MSCISALKSSLVSSRKSSASCPAPSGNPAAATVGIRTNRPAKSPPSGPAPLSPTFAAPAPSAPPTTFPHLDAAHIPCPHPHPLVQPSHLILALCSPLHPRLFF